MGVRKTTLKRLLNEGGAMFWGLYSVMIIGILCGYLWDFLVEQERGRYWRRKYEESQTTRQI